MRRAVCILALATGGAALVRCSSFEESPGAPDASSDSGGGTDGPLPPNDGGADGDRPDACGTDHGLCDDFNRGAPFLASIWSSELGAASRRIDTQPVGGKSTGGSFLAEVVEAGTQYYLHKTFAGPLKGLHCSLWMFLDDTAADYGHPFRITLSQGSPTPSHNFDAYIRPKTDTRESWLREPGVDHYMGTVGPGAWYHFEIDLPPLSVRVNSVLQDAGAGFDGGVDPTQVFGSAFLELGIGSDLYNPGWKVHFDDVVCDAR